MALTRASRPKLNQVEVPLDKRNQAQQDYHLRTIRKRSRLQADGANQKIPPLAGGELGTTFIEGGEIDSARELGGLGSV